MKKSLLFMALVPFLLAGCEVNINTSGNKSADEIIYKREVDDDFEVKEITTKVQDCIENKITSFKLSASIKQESDYIQASQTMKGTYTFYQDEFVESDVEMKIKEVEGGVGVETTKKVNEKSWRMDSDSVLSVYKYDDEIEFSDNTMVDTSLYTHSLANGLSLSLSGGSIYESKDGGYAFVQNLVTESYSAEVYGTETRELYTYMRARAILNVSDKGILKDYSISMVQKTNRDSDTNRWYSSPKEVYKIEGKATFETGTRKEFKEHLAYINAYSGYVYSNGYLSFYGAYFNDGAYDTSASTYNYPKIVSSKARVDVKDPNKIKLKILVDVTMPEEQDGYVNAYTFTFGADYYKDGVFTSSESALSKLFVEYIEGDDGVVANYDTGTETQWLVFGPGNHVLTFEFDIQIVETGLSVKQVY